MKKLISIFSMTLALTFAGQINAQNLVINGSFDSNIEAWDYNFNNANWVSDDGASISGNGSFRFGLIINNNAYRWAASEPIVVKPGYKYQTGMSAKLLTSSAANYLGAQVNWYDVADDLISQDFILSNVEPVPRDVWEDMYLAVTAPPNSVYVNFVLTLSVGGAGSPDEAFALWDDVFMLEDTLLLVSND